MKPLEFKIVETKTKDVVTGNAVIFFYEDGSTETITLGLKPKGLELNKHYAITDTYGYTVIDDRKGL